MPSDDIIKGDLRHNLRKVYQPDLGPHPEPFQQLILRLAEALDRPDPSPMENDQPPAARSDQSGL